MDRASVYCRLNLGGGKKKRESGVGALKKSFTTPFCPKEIVVF